MCWNLEKTGQTVITGSDERQPKREREREKEREKQNNLFDIRTPFEEAFELKK